MNDLKGDDTAVFKVKQTKYFPNHMSKVVLLAKYYQPIVNALTWDEFPDYGPYSTLSNTYDTVRLYMEPT